MESKRNMKEWVSSVLGSEHRLAMPIMTHPGITMIRKNVIDAVTDSNIHFQAITAMNDHFPAAASTIIMDLTVEAEAFGCKINFSEEEVPSISESLVHDIASVERLKVPDLTMGRMKEYIEATRLSATNISDKPVFAGCIGPFSLAGRLFGMTDILTAIYLEPDTIIKLLSKCTMLLTEYARAFKRAGSNGIIIAEPAAGLLPPEMCDQFSSDFVKHIVDAVQDDHFLAILHNCGRANELIPSMLGTGAGGLHLGNASDIIAALDDIPSDILVFGNLDPVGIFKNSSPKEIEKATFSLLEQTRWNRNFIISSGCDVPPGVPFANIRAFYTAMDKYHWCNFECRMDDRQRRA
jgi:uroporphyrinogen decarboxylase